MKPPIPRIDILRLARRAHLKPRHRRLRPIIRNAPRNREPRPAVRAINKRIPIPPIPHIQHLPQAIPARSRIRRNLRTHLPTGIAGNNPKSHHSPRFHLLHRHRLNRRQRRNLHRQPAQKLLHPHPLPFNLHHHPTGPIAHLSTQLQLRRKAVNVRTKPHPLHHPSDLHPPTNHPVIIRLRPNPHDRASSHRPPHHAETHHGR